MENLPTTTTPQLNIELIKRTVARDTTDDELKLFLYTCQRTGLDPLTKQIHCIKRGGQMAIQTGIDGYRVIAERSGNLAGIDDAFYDDETKDHPNKATVTVWKIVNGIRVSYSASARWSEYFSPVGPMWKKMPYLMLAKCAEALALRKAFPNDLSGIYTNEEMQQADSEPIRADVTVMPAKVTTTPAATTGSGTLPNMKPPLFHPCGKCGTPTKGTFPNCYSCNQAKKNPGVAELAKDFGGEVVGGEPEIDVNEIPF